MRTISYIMIGLFSICFVGIVICLLISSKHQQMYYVKDTHKKLRSNLQNRLELTYAVAGIVAVANALGMYFSGQAAYAEWISAVEYPAGFFVLQLVNIA